MSGCWPRIRWGFRPPKIGCARTKRPDVGCRGPDLSGKSMRGRVRSVRRHVRRGKARQRDAFCPEAPAGRSWEERRRWVRTRSSRHTSSSRNSDRSSGIGRIWSHSASAAPLGVKDARHVLMLSHDNVSGTRNRRRGGGLRTGEHRGPTSGGGFSVGDLIAARRWACWPAQQNHRILGPRPRRRCRSCAPSSRIRHPAPGRRPGGGCARRSPTKNAD